MGTSNQQSRLLSRVLRPKNTENPILDSVTVLESQFPNTFFLAPSLQEEMPATAKPVQGIIDLLIGLEQAIEQLLCLL